MPTARLLAFLLQLKTVALYGLYETIVSILRFSNMINHEPIVCRDGLIIDHDQYQRTALLLPWEGILCLHKPRDWRFCIVPSFHDRCLFVPFWDIVDRRLWLSDSHHSSGRFRLQLMYDREPQAGKVVQDQRFQFESKMCSVLFSSDLLKIFRYRTVTYRSTPLMAPLLFRISASITFVFFTRSPVSIGASGCNLAMKISSLLSST